MSQQEVDALDGVDLDRRRVLKAVAGGGAVLGGARAVDNVLLGYGVLTGTNLVEQDLAAVATEYMNVDRFDARVDDHRIVVSDGRLGLRDARGRQVATLPIAETTADEGADLDAEFGLAAGPLEQLVRDVRAIEAGEFSFAFSRTAPFFERVATADEVRPFAAGALRGRFTPGADPGVVAEFTDADPADPGAVVHGLVDAFREHTYYDLPRYAAGSVQDNVIFGAADLRQHFRTDVGFEALLDDHGGGMFCNEFTFRSMEALHAIAPHRQTVPVVAARVYDERHKHVYTAVGSVVREDGDLVIPMTFVDYTHTTLYDDLHLRGVMGEGLEAYDRRHMATVMYWD